MSANDAYITTIYNNNHRIVYKYIQYLIILFIQKIFLSWRNFKNKYFNKKKKDYMKN